MTKRARIIAGWAEATRIAKNAVERAQSRPDKPQMGKKAALSREAPVIKAVGQLLASHSAVAYAWRHNVGAVKIDGRFVRFGTPGISDYVGFLKDGRFLAVECKAPGKEHTLTVAQDDFLRLVRGAGGFGCMVSDVRALAILLRNWH